MELSYKPGQSLVISTWQTTQEWQQWLNSPERKTIQDQIDALLGEKTEYEIYGHTQWRHPDSFGIAHAIIFSNHNRSSRGSPNS